MTTGPSLVAVETRLTLSEADALDRHVLRLAALVQSDVLEVPAADKPDLLTGLDKLLAAVRLRMEPF